MTRTTFEKRAGCYNCFKLLDPGDPSPNRQHFVRCTKCNALYHKNCRTEEIKCFRCGQSEVAPHEILSIPPLKAVLKHRPISIRPSAIFKVDRRDSIIKIAQAQHVGNLIIYANDWITAVISAGIIMAVATGLGAYTFRIFSLIDKEGISADGILDAILKQPIPDTSLFLYAGVASIIFGFFFLHTRYNDTVKAPKVGFFNMLISSFVLLLCINVLLLELTLPQLISLPNTSRIWPLILSEIGSLALILLITPVYRHTAPALPKVTDFITPEGRDSLVIIWYLIITVSLLWLSINVSDTLTQHVMQSLNTFVRSDTLELTFPPLQIGSLAIALLTALFLYYLPIHLRASNVIKILRRLLIFLCLGTIAYTYTLVPNPEIFLRLLLIVGATTLLLTPLYHVLFSVWANYRTVITKPVSNQSSGTN